MASFSVRMIEHLARSKDDDLCLPAIVIIVFRCRGQIMLAL